MEQTVNNRPLGRAKMEVKDLNLFYGDFQALKHVSISMPEKEITAFIGPSGCGKSTLLKTLNRMNDLVEGCRIEGQVRGLQEMLQKDAYCPDILIQVSAVGAALNSFSKELLATHIRTCVADGIRQGDDEVIDELVTTLQKLMK